MGAAMLPLIVPAAFAVVCAAGCAVSAWAAQARKCEGYGHMAAVLLFSFLVFAGYALAATRTGCV